ncbi:MAG: glutamine synthetase, partial [Candidatus Eremiobacteraeota bacterium]|nr:glutamine synthetase [Candidatus Eremiobacteraeota bacterium]
MLSAVNGKGVTKRDVLKAAKDAGVKYVRLTFVDILGIEKSVSVPVAELERAIEGKVSFDGGSIDGFVRDAEVDMILIPDLSSFAVLPWTKGAATEARLICAIANADGSDFEGDPRTTLRRVLDDARDVLAQVETALEVEFYLFPRGENGPIIQISEVGSYFDWSPNDRGDDARCWVVAALQEMGLEISSSHHEHGPDQHEIDLAEAPVLRSADNFVTLRGAVKHVASGLGLEATFMPKPSENLAGNGLHMYFSLQGLDEDQRLHAIGGLLAHAPAATAVCNPTVNSYKRLVAAWDARIYTVWSEASANTLVRIPTAPGMETKIEMRSPDPSCNPYLAFAVLIESIADGLRNRRLPGDPFTGSSYELTGKFRSERGIRTLPKSLRQAIDELEADNVLRGALGDHIYHAFRDAKLAEYERYRR